MKSVHEGADSGANVSQLPAATPQVDPELVELAMAALNDETAGISRLHGQPFFYFEFEGEDLLFTKALRAAVEAKLGEPLVEVVLPILAGQVNLLPAARAKALQATTVQVPGAQPC